MDTHLRLHPRTQKRTPPRLLRNLAAGLFEHGEIRTTMPKAKAVQPFVERIITMARQGNLHARRQLEAKFGRDRWIHVWVADENVPESRKLSNPWFNLPRAEDIQFDDRGEVVKAPRLVEHIMSVVAPMFEGREGGYTGSSEPVSDGWAMLLTL